MKLGKYIDVQGVEQTFKTPKGSFQALRDIDFSVAKGEFVALIKVATAFTFEEVKS